MRIAFLRHGPTEWNAQGRIQGRTNIPLSDLGRAKIAALLPPKGFERVRAFTSPLDRARETAKLMGFADAVPDERLIEHHWGAWEGLTREEILARYGEDVFVRAGMAADFTPLDGEATHDLLARVADFIADVAQSREDAIAIVHTGIMRSAYTIGSGWDMKTPMPEKLDLSGALILEVAPDGATRIDAMNVALRSR